LKSPEVEKRGAEKLFMRQVTACLNAENQANPILLPLIFLRLVFLAAMFLPPIFPPTVFPPPSSMFLDFSALS